MVILTMMMREASLTVCRVVSWRPGGCVRTRLFVEGEELSFLGESRMRLCCLFSSDTRAYRLEVEGDVQCALDSTG